MGHAGVRLNLLPKPRLQRAQSPSRFVPSRGCCWWKRRAQDIPSELASYFPGHGTRITKNFRKEILPWNNWPYGKREVYGLLKKKNGNEITAFCDFTGEGTSNSLILIGYRSFIFEWWNNNLQIYHSQIKFISLHRHAIHILYLSRTVKQGCSVYQYIEIICSINPISETTYIWLKFLPKTSIHVE